MSLILNATSIAGCPARVVSFADDPKLLSVHTTARTRPVSQLLLHRGAEVAVDSPQRTKRILDARELSSLFTLTPDGTVYQHFDPATRRGRHATHHNVQSDSIDVQGPLSVKKAGMLGQSSTRLMVAIGREDDAAQKSGKRADVLARKKVKLDQWSLTPSQAATLRAFVPFWCALRGIPSRACSDYRTFRPGGLGVNDPATNVTGILAHAQVSGPGQRVDGFIELEALRGAAGIEWRDGPEFWT